MSYSVPKNLSKVIQIDENQIHEHLGELVRGSVEETLDSLVNEEANQLCNARGYERATARQDYRFGHYQGKLQSR